MLSFKSSKYPNAFPNLRHLFCICIREHLNLYSYSSVVKGVIRIRFHANPIRLHSYSVQSRRRLTLLKWNKLARV
jgi:hypothetical protein